MMTLIDGNKRVCMGMYINACVHTVCVNMFLREAAQIDLRIDKPDVKAEGKGLRKVMQASPLVL